MVDQAKVPTSFQRLLVVLIAVLAICGCEHPPQRPSGKPGLSSVRNDRGASLLSAAATQLNNLPPAVDTLLRTPTVVLDSRKSADQKDILGVCTSNPPGSSAGPFNVIQVPEGNARFKSARIKPGDIVKFYIRTDETLDKQSIEAGLGKMLPVDLTVAQVADENILIVEEDLRQAIEFPFKVEIWRYMDDRMEDIRDRLSKYATYRLPALNWEPSPDAPVLTQIVDWLNQWSRQITPSSEFKVDPLASTINPAYLKDEQFGPLVTNGALSAREFPSYAGRLLQEAVWLRDISRWAPRGKFDELSKAEALFDWTIRNIQLDADEGAAPHRPWQVLIYGHGTAEQRTWVFALLCRQQGLDVVVLTPAGEAKAAGGFALPAVLAGGKLYLFDTRLGLPLRGPDGVKVATLDELRGDDNLLRKLDLDGEAAYPVTATALEQVNANIVADNFDLSQAAWQLERKLTGENRVVLTSNATELAEHVKSLTGVAAVQLWDTPFRIMRDQMNLGKEARLSEALSFEPFAWRPALWKARVLHFQGRRPAGDTRSQPTEDVPTSHADAIRMYSSNEVRPSLREPAWASPDKQRIALALHTNAAYWVGLLLYDDGKYDVAAQWLERPELKRAGSPWFAGAKYNLARTREAQGKNDEAVKILLDADKSPQKQGNQLRAERLKANTRAEKQD